jgi:citrate synthase
MAEADFAKGLEGVIAAESEICLINGEKGSLNYRGYEISDLAENSNFAESAFLLLFGDLPTEEQLETFREKLAKARKVDDSIIDALRALPKDSHPMVALQAAVAAQGSLNAVDGGPSDDNEDRAIELISKFPTFVAAWARLRKGKEPIEPRQDLGHGQNFLYMIDGNVPEEEVGHIFDVCLILHMEHSFNASTFTARVVSSTEAPLDAALSAAVGALYGPLHGGANERVLNMLDDIESPEAAPDFVKNALENKRKIMGMGHRVYKAKDPRAYVLEDFLKRLVEKKGGSENYEKLKAVEKTMEDIMEAKGKKIYPNVDYFSGSLYSLLGIETEEFTPIFAIARSVGWCSHVLEQWQENRIFRPRAKYVGHQDRKWEPIEER